MSDTNQRMVYGKTLVELGRQDERIVVLDADLANCLRQSFRSATLKWELQKPI